MRLDELTEYIELEILNHLQATFAQEHRLGICIANKEGKSLLYNTEYMGISDKVQPVFDRLVSNQLDFNEIHLQEGYPVFSSLFNGAILRIVVPIVYNQVFFGGICFFKKVKEPSGELLSGENDLFSNLDSQTVLPSDELLTIVDKFKSQLLILLEAGWKRIDSINKNIENEHIGEAKADIVIYTTQNSDIVDATNAAIALLGYESVEEIVGLNVLQNLILDGMEKQFLVQQALKTGLAGPKILLFECKDGSTFHAGLTISINKDDQNRSVGFEYMLSPDRVKVDGTEFELTHSEDSRETEQTLDVEDFFSILRAELEPLEKVQEQQETHLQFTADIAELFNSVPHPLFIIDGDDKVQIWNSAIEKLLDIPADKMLGHDFRKLLVTDRRPLWEQWVIQFRLEQQNTYAPVGDLLVLDKNKDMIKINVTFARNEILGNANILVAVTKSVKEPLLLTRSIPVDYACDDDAEAISCCIHPASQFTPIQDIIPAITRIGKSYEKPFEELLGYTSMIAFEKLSAEKQEQLIYQIHKKVENLSGLNRQLLDLYERTEIHLKPLAVRPIIFQAISIQQQLFPNNISFSTDVKPNTCHMMADSRQVHRAFVHLLENSCEAMPKGGKIEIKVREMDKNGDNKGYIQIMISDTGVGISQAMMPYIFEPFFSTKTHKTGAGLGLACVYSIIKKHHGYIEATSKPGKGSKFILYLPQIDPKSKPKEASMSDQKTDKKSVLMIDDDEQILEITKMMLQQRGFDVFTAKTAREGNSVFKKHNADINVVIVDVMLPDMTGADCAQALLKIKPSIPIVMTSGYPATGAAKQISEKTGGGWLQKPFNRTKLITALEQALKS